VTIFLRPASRRATLALALLALTGCGDDAPAPPIDAGPPVDAGPPGMPRVLPPFCEPPAPPDEALRRADDPALFVGGRARAPLGTEVALGGFPVQVVAHPRLPVAYVANAGYRKRAVQVVDAATGAVLQELARDEAFYGLALSPDGAQLYASAGHGAEVERYDVDAMAGTLTARDPVAIEGYPAGLALSPDGATLWVAQFRGEGIVEVDTATMTARAPIALPASDTAYHLLHLPARGELYATAYRSTNVVVIDTATRAVVATIAVGGNPSEAVLAPDGRVLVSVADGEVVVAIDPATRAVTTRAQVNAGDAAQVDEDGTTPLPGASPTGLAVDAPRGRLYVARSADNAIGVLDLATLAPAGALPTGWYPTDVALAAEGAQLVVVNGKGLGSGPLLSYGLGDEGGKESMNGSVQVVALAGVDLDAASAAVAASIARPGQVFPFDCAGTYPVPPVRGGPTPIEHVVLIVRENKTYDSVFGDLEEGDGDPALVLYGEDVTPNLHALARTYANHDNFYADIETSVQGHLFLTHGFVNDYVERTWFEDYRYRPGFGRDAAEPQGVPDMGSFFEHLIVHGVPFTVYGEIVGATGRVGDVPVTDFVDTRFPGIFYNTGIPDERKARYVARQLAANGLPKFVYVLLPNDHTGGSGPDDLSPESMINDNDYATGLLVEAISQLPEWERTAVFITQDDTQIGADHVDYHRTVLVVASPWARRGTSSVNTSFASLFATFERILDLPPMNRLDANATPLYDAFTTTPNAAPYVAVPRTLPDRTNAGGTPASLPWPPRPNDAYGPDRDPDLGRRLWEARRGTAFPGRVVEGRWPTAARANSADEDEDADVEEAAERDAHDAAWAEFLRYVDAHPERLRPW
jgi:YVTN family beta-propeller protein